MNVILTCPCCRSSEWEPSKDSPFKKFVCKNCEATSLLSEMCAELKQTDNTEWFGIVRWCEADVRNALEIQDYPVTENNIEKLIALCNSHWFTDHMIEAGWEWIYNNIGYGDGWDEPEE